MKHETRNHSSFLILHSSFLLLSSSFIIPHSSFAAAPADAGLVADPYRSVDVTWPKHEIKGRDYWLMVYPCFLGLKGLESEPFLNDSGTAFVTMRAESRRADPWGFAGPNDFHKIGDVIGDKALKERLKRAPFEVWSPIGWGSGLKQTTRNFDYAGYDKLIADYGETFLGVRYNEWDAGILHSLHRYTAPTFLAMKEIMKLPCNRAEMRENFHAMWKAAQVRNGSRMYGLSGQTSFMHWGCEWGGTVSCVELQSEVTEYPFRNSIMFTRSAARQFNVPMEVYTAYFRGPYSPDSRPDRPGAHAGREVSLAWREHLLSYYMGNNFQDFESQWCGHAEQQKDGSYVLTENGLEIRRLYEWTKSEKGKRGECYTPILFLLDRNHGFDQLSWTGIDEGFGPFKGAYLPSDADFYTEYAMQAIAPRYRWMHKESNPDKSANLRSSPLGDIFDVYIANSDVPGKELRDDQLAKYSVVMALSDIVWNNQLVNRIRKYVYEGGTFVATATQAQPFNEELGIKNDELRKNSPSFLIPHSSFLTNTIVKSFGRGNFVLVTNPWMKQEKERWRVPQQMKDLLQKLHDEVVPFKITGTCEFLYNRMPDGSWKAIIMNNSGTAKNGPDKNTPPDPKWTRTVTLELPENAEVEEVLEGLSPAITSGLPGGQPLPAGSSSSSPSAVDSPSSSPSAVDSPSSSPSAVDSPSSSPSAVGADRRAARMKRVSFDIPSGQVIVVNVRGIKNKNSTVQPQPSTSTSTSSPLKPSSFPDQAYKPHPVYDQYRFNPKEHEYLDCAPGRIFDWENPTGGKEAVTTNAIVTAKYYLPMCTFDVEAKASLDPAKAPKGRHEGTLFFASELINVGIDRDNRWYVSIYLANNVRIVGPKATGDWQKIRVTFDRGTVRFFVDGKEYKDAKRGVIKVPQKDCRDRFYERVNIDVGEAHHGWGNYFPGIVKSMSVVPWAGEEFKLWPEGKTPDFQKHQTEPYFIWCEPQERKSDMVVIAISGGGYRSCGIGGFEVLPIRDYLLDRGITVVTLVYRTPRPEGLRYNQSAWEDAQRAIRLVRHEAKKRGLNPEKIGFTGGSAGGNLTLLAAVSSQTPAYAPIDEIDKEPCHVNWAVPIYAAYVIKGTGGGIPGKDDAANLALPLEDDLKFDAKTPPMCLFVGDGDGWAPHSVRVWQKLHTMNIPVELHILTKKGHCFQMPSRITRGALSETWKDVFWQWLLEMGYVK